MTMTELNGVHESPAPERFVVRGQTFEVQLLDLIYELEDMLDQSKAAGETDRQYLSRVIAHIQARYGAALTFGEADWLRDELGKLYAKKKRERADAIATIAKWQNSMDSTHSN